MDSVCPLNPAEAGRDRYNTELTKERDALILELYKNNIHNGDLKQQYSELQKRLCVLLAEKAAMQLGVDELQKKLEMFGLLLQQLPSQSEAPDSNQQFQQAIEEWAQAFLRATILRSYSGRATGQSSQAL